MKRLERGQVLLFIILILGVIGVLAGSLAAMWQSEVKSRSLARQRMIAFYLAEAAVERAKIEVLRETNPPAGECPGTPLNARCPATTPANLPGYRELDPDLTDNFTWYYTYTITSAGGAAPSFHRLITGTGKVLDANGVVLAIKRVQVEVEDIDPATGVDGDGTATPVSYSWSEL